MDGFIKKLQEKFDWFKQKKNASLRTFVMLLLAGICVLVILWPMKKDGAGTDKISTSTSNSIWGNNSAEEGGEGENAMDTEKMAKEGNEYENKEYITYLENKLKEVLLTVKNVGECNVMITLKDYGEQIVEKDNSISESVQDSETQKSSSEETVFRHSDSGDVPYVSKNLEPQIAGVVISCEGGGNPDTVLAITNAVQALFDVPVHKIVVLEAK